MFTSLYSPFPFHSVYSVEDHKKHVDWIKTVNPRALVSVKVSTPTDVDMVAIGSYYAGANIIHIDAVMWDRGGAGDCEEDIAMPSSTPSPSAEVSVIRRDPDQITLMLAVVSGVRRCSEGDCAGSRWMCYW